jgi:hypothetical protein
MSWKISIDPKPGREGVIGIADIYAVDDETGFSHSEQSANVNDVEGFWLRAQTALDEHKQKLNAKAEIEDAFQQAADVLAPVKTQLSEKASASIASTKAKVEL